jgi:RNA polymerase sigma-70 factor (ECF subfamily)
MAMGRELETLLQRAMTKLEEEHRALIVLRDIENLPYNEICTITGLKPGTVKSRLHRARVALKEEVRRLYE